MTVFTSALDPDWSFLLSTSSTVTIDGLNNTSDFNDLYSLQRDFVAPEVPRLTGVAFFESEFDSQCMGFELIYADYSSETFLYTDTLQYPICKTTTILADTEGKIITDVQVEEPTAQTRALSVKFVTNDGSEEFCGPEATSYTSLIP